MKQEATIECNKYAEDVKLWAEFQTGINIFGLWLNMNEEKIKEGLTMPNGLVEACEILKGCQLCLAESDKKYLLLKTASEASKKMNSYQNTDILVDGYKNRWTNINKCYMDWTAR